jgi:hypothetical protein
MIEQRQCPRLKDNAEFTVTIQSSPFARELEGKVFSTNSVDLSLNGIKLIVDTPVHVGTRFELKIMLNNLSTAYWYTGNVVWNLELQNDDTESEPLHATGIRFIDLLNNPQYLSWEAAILELQASHHQVH